MKQDEACGGEMRNA